MKHEKLVHKLEKMVIDGIESHIIDEEIDKQRLPDYDRKIIFRHIQDFQIKLIKSQQTKEHNLNVKLIGWTVLSIGLIITIGTFIYNKSVIVIAYGAVLYGLFVIMRRKLHPNLEEDGSIKKRGMFDKGLFKKF